MAALFVDVEFGWHVLFTKSQIKFDAVFSRDSFVSVGVKEKRRRRLAGDLPFVGKADNEFRIGVFSE